MKISGLSQLLGFVYIIERTFLVWADHKFSLKPIVILEVWEDVCWLFIIFHWSCTQQHLKADLLIFHIRFIYIHRAKDTNLKKLKLHICCEESEDTYELCSEKIQICIRKYNCTNIAEQECYMLSKLIKIQEIVVARWNNFPMHSKSSF